MTWDVATADSEWLVNLVHEAERNGAIVGGQEGRTQVVKISEHVMVKYGGLVRISEAATQDFAYRTVDPSVVHVPRVYRFIEARDSLYPKGYLFMEYISGQNLKEVDLEARKDLFPRIAKIAEHLGQIRGGNMPPGPVGGGEPDGYLYGDDGAKTVFNSVEDMNTYMNKRLALRNDSIDLAPYPLVLCHLDFYRRSMILEDDGVSLCLVDWGYAGFYPRFFEVAMIPCVLPYDASYEKPVMQEIEKLLCLTDEENRLVKLIRCVRAANLRWSFDERPPFDFAAWMASIEEEKLNPSKESRPETPRISFESTLYGDAKRPEDPCNTNGMKGPLA
ncbi:hypothetical protein L228DRAFT_261210 [Xylona heveae TC161]|uniref:Aminoglycoside phosphotransferase domain-containing protein n=1 Tax=Xylona heveae (strain CBS 132557 / TC161) TaxID=1328760 RepID=A0A165GAZ3_XYLHT|nr:hypothetical protein L228DRAFT_261210 [Xylona heveae TC161]KZF21965.1 hypothetical protein L228DRAFT_261210 [Xylona heveae TC161]